MRRIVIRVIIAVIIVMALLVLFKDVYAKSLIERHIRYTTGCKVVSDRFDIGLFNTDLAIHGLLIMNPKDFQEKIMFDVADLYIDFDIPALMKKKAHIHELRIDIDEIIVVKNKYGELNLNALRVLKADKQGKKPDDIADEDPFNLDIGILHLRIKKLIYKDNSQMVNGKGKVQEFELNIDEKIHDVQNAYAVVRVILSEAIRKAAINNIINVNMELLTKPVSGILGYADKIVKTALGTGEKKVDGTTVKQNGTAVKQKSTVGNTK